MEIVWGAQYPLLKEYNALNHIWTTYCSFVFGI